jgi:hypothetical protein
MKSFGTLGLRDVVDDSHKQLQLTCKRIYLDIGRECVKRADLWNIDSIFSFKVECPGDIEWIISLRHFMSTSLQGGSNAKYL